MSDQRIRDLERSFRESGDPQDGGRLLRAREQAQELPPRAIRALAYIGDPGAVQLLDAPAAQEPIGLTALAVWLEGLGTLGRHVLARAQHAILTWAHDVAWGEGFPQRNSLQRGFLNASSTWIEDLRGWIQQGYEGAEPQLEVHRDGLVVFCSYRSARGELAHHLLRAGLGSAAPGWESRVGDYAGDPTRVTLPDVRTQGAVVAEVVSGVRQALSPWLQGAGDPLQVPPAHPAVSLASSCPSAWDAMAPGPVRCARVCHGCGATVFEMGRMPLEEARTLLEGEGGPCWRVYRRDDGKIMTGDCLVGLRSLADPYAGVEPDPGLARTVFANPAPAFLDPSPPEWPVPEVTVNPGPRGFAGNPREPSDLRGGDPPVTSGDPLAGSDDDVDLPTSMDDVSEWLQGMAQSALEEVNQVRIARGLDPLPLTPDSLEPPAAGLGVNPFAPSTHDPFAPVGVDPFAPAIHDPFAGPPGRGSANADADDPFRVASGPEPDPEAGQGDALGLGEAAPGGRQ